MLLHVCATPKTLVTTKYNVDYVLGFSCVISRRNDETSQGSHGEMPRLRCRSAAVTKRHDNTRLVALHGIEYSVKEMFCMDAHSAMPKNFRYAISSIRLSKTFRALPGEAPTY